MIGQRSRRKRAEILLVEDNPGDVMLIREALKENEAGVHLSVAQDGVEALAFLRQEGRYVDVPRPDLILLDLNLPKKNGHDVLAEIKGDEWLKCIPVIILTTSDAVEDVRKAYDRFANCYTAKPADLEGFFDLIRVIEHFWLDIAELPSR